MTSDQMHRWRKIVDRVLLVIGLVVLVMLVAFAIWILATLDQWEP